MPTWTKINFQNANSPVIEHLIFFNDHSIIILINITIIVFYIIIFSLINIRWNRNFFEAQKLEYFWSIYPALILIFIAFPSLKILYFTEESINSNLNIKITGHQWYWSYEYTNFSEIKFDSFITKNKLIRLIDTSNHLVVPIKTPIRFILTSADVIHSWTIPRLGLKIDAIPGRINQISTLINRPGLIAGQCSEICGTNHRFIPIIIESISIKKFLSLISNN